MAIRKSGLETTTVEILEIQRARARYHLIGTTPIIPRTLWNKEGSAVDLLLGGRKKNAAEKASKIKHNPYDEMRSSCLLLRNDDAPTYVGMPIGAFKGALRDSTKDTPGATKAQLGRLTFFSSVDNGDRINDVPIYGHPFLFMSVVRSSDMARTPDIRTRAIIPRWYCEIEVAFAVPNLNLDTISRGLANAGNYIGIGDWRQEKGSGSYGAFRIANPEDEADAAEIESIRQYGRLDQIEAFKNPEPFDGDTADMLEIYDAEVRRRQTEHGKVKKETKK